MTHKLSSSCLDLPFPEGLRQDSVLTCGAGSHPLHGPRPASRVAVNELHRVADMRITGSLQAHSVSGGGLGGLKSFSVNARTKLALAGVFLGVFSSYDHEPKEKKA